MPQEQNDPKNVKTDLFRKMQRATEDLVHHMTNYATATAALNAWCAERLHPHDSRITASILVDESVPVDTYNGILAIQAGGYFGIAGSCSNGGTQPFPKLRIGTYQNAFHR